jgi:RecA/RadA recombinase
MQKAKRIKPVNKLSLAKQVKSKTKEVKKPEVFDNDKKVISTGSTLLDLAISGGVVKGGGIPGGITVVAYGPSGGGKTALACEIAGSIARQGGELKYRDSEGRLDAAFAKNFDLDVSKIDLKRTRTISTTFNDLSKWKPDPTKINGFVIDSLASLSTEIELDDGDKMGMRRAKEFSEQLRKCTVPVGEQNIILFCTNQIREKADAQKYERKDINPGGKAIEFYSSLILRFSGIKKIKKEFKFGKKDTKETIGMEATIEVDKSSIWKPHRTAPIIIYFDYGIDDVRANLQYVKDYTGESWYQIKDIKLSNSLDKAVAMVEEQNLESKLRKQVIAIWEAYDAETTLKRKRKER